jgi:hypothetical protein
MDTDAPAGLTPDSSTNPSGSGEFEQDSRNAELLNAMRSLFSRQEQIEAELAGTRAAINNAGPTQLLTAPGNHQSETAALTSLVKSLIETLTVTTATNSAREPSGPRDWKPPTWDGRAETFRDYLLRLRSSYRVRSALKPSLSEEYYWNVIYDTLPSRERARMRHFWEKGSATKGKDPEAFFTQLESVFSDGNEQQKALEQLTTLKHAVGQPWHEHQLEFDGLLLSAGGDSWPNLTKIGYLKNTFSNPAKIYTAAIPKTEDYYTYADEVERIMTNLEGTDQFRAAHKRWLKERNKDSVIIVSEYAKPQVSTTPLVDADGDTVMAPARTAGGQFRKSGNRKVVVGASNKQKAKWVDVAERERRRENRLCFRCGAGGHRVKECPYAPAVRPSSINAVNALPVLEDDAEASESVDYESGKE